MLLLLFFLLLPSTLSAGCKCTGSNLGIDTAKHGTSFGTSCAAWEDGTHPENTHACPEYTSDVGFWCCRPWCYIDAMTCDGGEVPYFSSFVQEGNDPTLFYSFAACEKDTSSLVSYEDESTCPFKGPALYEPPVRVVASIRNKSDYEHEHFGCSVCSQLQGQGTFTGDGLKNIVADTLNADGKPVLNPDRGFSDRDKANFLQWYSDDVCATQVPLVFDWNKEKDLHSFDSSNYLPLGHGTTDLGLFTSEMHVYFQYNGGETFNFLGDDDVWVFVNKKLVMDIGGCHGAQPGSVSLDTVADSAGIVVGGTYALALFHAERCYGASNFAAEVTLRQDQGVCPNQCYEKKEHGTCDTGLGKCSCYPGWEGADCGTCNQDWCMGGKHTEVEGACTLDWREDYYSTGYKNPIIDEEQDFDAAAAGRGRGWAAAGVGGVAVLLALV